MFQSPHARVILRSTLVGVGLLLSSLVASTTGSDLTSGEILLGVSSGFSGALAYAGINYGSSSVNPAVGNK